MGGAPRSRGERSLPSPTNTMNPQRQFLPARGKPSADDDPPELESQLPAKPQPGIFEDFLHDSLQIAANALSCLPRSDLGPRRPSRTGRSRWWAQPLQVALFRSVDAGASR